MAAPATAGVVAIAPTEWGTEAVPKVTILAGCDDLASLCRMGDVDKLRAFLEEDEGADVGVPLDSEGNTGLHMAAFFGHLRLAQELLERSAQVDAREARQRTPLHIACKEGYAEVALELLVKKADANAVDISKESPVHKACIPSSIEVLKVVAEHGGADLTVADCTGMTPLLLAAKCGNVEFITYLLSKDAGLVGAKNEAHWTALHLAAHGQDAKVNAQNPGKYNTSVRLLLEAKSTVDATDEDKRTPLHRAAAIGNCLSAGLLVDAGASMDAADQCRWRPIHYACQNAHEKMVALLLGKRAAAQLENPDCLTPLAVATMENKPKIAEMLVKQKADPNLRGPGLASPLMLARKDKTKYADILSLFELGFINHAA